MRLPDWLYFPLFIAGSSAFIIITGVLLYSAVKFPDTFTIDVAPFFLTAPIAYAILSRRIHNPSQRRFAGGIILAILGVFVYIASPSYSPQNPLLQQVAILSSFILTGAALSITLSLRKQTGYLPTAGTAMAAAAVPAFFIMLLSLLTALGHFGSQYCYAGIAPCPPATFALIGTYGIIGFASGLVSSGLLLRGRSDELVLAAFTFLSFTAFLTLSIGDTGLALFGEPLLALSLVSILFALLNKIKVSEEEGSPLLKASDWRLITILAGGLAALSVVLGTFVFATQSCSILCDLSSDGASGFVILWLISLGISGALIILPSLYSAYLRRSRVSDSVKATLKQVRRSQFLKGLILLILCVNLSFTGVFSALVLAPAQPQFCYCRAGIDLLSITQLSFGPSANQVTFQLWNSGTHDVTITIVLAMGIGISGQASLSTNTVVPKGQTVYLTVTFSNVTFQSGVRYDFTLISSTGNKFPTSGIA